MKDQAETLRKMMQSGSSHFGNGSPEILNIVSGKSGSGKSLVALSLGKLLVQEGKNVLLIELGKKHERRRVTTGFEILTLDSDLFGIENILCKEESDLFTKVGVNLENVDIVLVEIRSEYEFLLETLIHPKSNNLILMTESRRSIRSTLRFLQLLRNHVSCSRENFVLVNQVTDGVQARALFRELKKESSSKIDMNLSYLGHLPKDKRVKKALGNWELLVELEKESSFLICLGILYRRMKSALNSSKQGEIAQKSFRSFDRLPISER